MVYTRKQLEVMRLWQTNKLHRINLLEGSVSSGKTWISLVLWAFWVKTMPSAPDRLYLMTGRSLTTLKRNCLIPLQGLVGERNFSYKIASKEGQLFGRHIILEGANDAQAESKIRGATLQGAYCDELTKLPEDFFAMLLSRLRLAGSKLFATTNPDKPTHWLKTDYIDRAEDIDILDVKFKLEDNDTLPAEYIENIKKEYTGVFYERFILGKWTLAEGLIYPMYEAALSAPPDGVSEQKVLSIDYGTMNAFAAALWERHGEVWYMVDEYYYSGRDEGVQKTDEEYARDIDGFVGQAADETDKIRTIIDPSGASFIALLRKRGKYRVIPADNAVVDGIRETATCLQVGAIKVSPKCQNWLKEVQGYVWDDTSLDDRPIKEDDHLMDATRYFVKTMNIAKAVAKKGERDRRDYLSGLAESGEQRGRTSRIR